MSGNLKDYFSFSLPFVSCIFATYFVQNEKQHQRIFEAFERKKNRLDC